jgi:membrane protein DedA with SNARE-associated domain
MSYATLLALLHAYKYAILFPLAFVEGPAVALVCGTLIAAGYLAPLPTYVILFFGDFVPDTLYFWLGHVTRRSAFVQRQLSRAGFQGQRLAAIERLWHRHTFKAVLVSKWALGLSTPLLMSGGIARVSLREFLTCAVPIILFQYGVLLTLGYEFGSSFNVLQASLHTIGFIVAGFVMFWIVLMITLSHFAKKTIASHAAS